MMGITIRPGTPAMRIRRLLARADLLVSATGLYLVTQRWTRAGLVLLTVAILMSVIPMILEEIRFAKGQPRPPVSLRSHVIGALLVFAIWGLPILFFPANHWLW